MEYLADVLASAAGAGGALLLAVRRNSKTIERLDGDVRKLTGQVTAILTYLKSTNGKGL